MYYIYTIIKNKQILKTIYYVFILNKKLDDLFNKTNKANTAKNIYNQFTGCKLYGVAKVGLKWVYLYNAEIHGIKVAENCEGYIICIQKSGENITLKTTHGQHGDSGKVCTQKDYTYYDFIENYDTILNNFINKTTTGDKLKPFNILNEIEIYGITGLSTVKTSKEIYNKFDGDTIKIIEHLKHNRNKFTFLAESQFPKF